MKEIYCPQTYRINKEYPIYLGEGIISELPKRIVPFRPNKVLLITDSNVRKIHGEKILELLKENFEVELIDMPPGEANKTFQNYIKLCNDIIDSGITKNSFLVLLGGGVVGNLAGFAASTVMRGLNFAHVPTTIMAQTDSTTGGKQAVNMPQGKNLLGVFNDPQFILEDINFLDTLPPREVACGLAECIKHAVCQDKNFVDEMLKKLNSENKYTHETYMSIVNQTIHLKLSLLRMDPKEINEGKVLVYGHTIGHAIETLAEGRLNHGESISIGMMAVAKAAVKLGVADNSLVEIHEKLLTQAGLPVKIPEDIAVDQIINQLKYDKKVSQTIELVLLEGVGAVHSIEGRIGYPVNNEQLKEILQECY